MFKKNTIWTLLGVLVMLAMIITACAPAAETPTEAPEEPEVAETEEMEEEAPPVEMAEVDFDVIPGGFLEKALAGEYAGTEVTVDGPFVDPDTIFMDQSMEAFEEARRPA
jgi:alpha-glucoside transport system substrate-binding protein